MRAVNRADRVAQRMDGAKTLLEGDRAHGRRTHHMRAGFHIIRVGIDLRQVFQHQPHAFQRDALRHRMVERAGIGFQAMGKGIHPRAGGDEARHAHGQLGVADGDGGKQFRVEDDLLLVGLRIGQNPGAAHFGPGPCRGRHGDDGRDLAGIGARPPVIDIFQVPDRHRLARHQRNHLAQIQRRSAAKADHPVVPARAVDGKARFHVAFVRVGINLREDRPAKTCGVQNVQRLRRDRQGCQRLVGDQQRLFQAGRLAMVSQFRNAARAEFHQGRVGPVSAQVHFVTFLRW